MELKDLIGANGDALVEFYDNSAACDEANRLTEQVKSIMGPDTPVYRINVADEPREGRLARLTTLPTIIIYRNRREEWVMTSDFPSAEVLAERLTATLQAPGAVNPLKGRPRL